MARPKKLGIDYYPWDVDADQDDKLSMVIAEFGDKGELLYQKLCGYIYKHGGYCIKWDEQEQLKFAKRVAYIGGASVNLIKEIVARCIKWGLFDKTVFESSFILTSVRIQRTWLEATRKRLQREINKSVWLLPEETQFPPEEINNRHNKQEKTSFPAEEMQQSKVNESKEKNGDVIQPSPMPPRPGYMTLVDNKEAALSDTGMHSFSETYHRAGLQQPLLGEWMDAFHVQLEHDGDTIKLAKDYRQHFGNWLKYQDLRSDPKKFSPVKISAGKDQKADRITENKRLL